MKITKQKLKEDYYWEFDRIYDALPDELEVPEYQETTLIKVTTNADIIKENNIVPYSVEQAFAVASLMAEKLEKGKWKVVYFKKDDTLCRLYVWRRDGGGLDVRVRKVDPDGRWGAGRGVVFSNKILETQTPLNPSILEPLTLEKAIQICKENGLKVIKLEIKEIQL